MNLNSTLFGIDLRLICIVVSLGTTALGESWTNAANHAIQATLVARNGQTITLRQVDGSLLKIPLKSLAEMDRARAKKRFPDPVIPSSEEKMRLKYQKRISRFKEAGYLSSEERNQELARYKKNEKKCAEKPSLPIKK